VKEFLTDAEMMNLEKQSISKAPDFISDDEMNKLESGPSYDYSNIPQVASDLVKTNVDALPMYAQTLGSALSGGNPIIAGAAQAAGNSLKQGLYGVKELVTGERPLSDELRLPTKEEALAVATDAVNNFNEGVIAEKGGQFLGKAVQKGAQAIQGAAPSVKQTAKRLAARAVGAERGTIKKLGADKVEEIGAYALDNNILGKGFNNTDDMIAANAAEKTKGGEKMNEVYTAIDDAGKSKFNPQNVAYKVEEELGDFIRDPLNKGMTKQFENTLESIIARGNENIPIKKAQELKETLGKAANWTNKLNITDKEKLARDAYKVISNSIDSAVEQGAKEIGSDGLLNTLKEGKKLYGSAKNADELLVNKLAREQGNKLLGLTDWNVLGPAGIGAVLTGGASIGPTVAFLGAKKYGENFGAQQSALALNKVSKYLKDSPKLLSLSKESPKLFEQVVTKTAQNIMENYRTEPKKGEAKWLQNGATKVIEHSSLPQEVVDEVAKNPQFRGMLIQASEYKKGSQSLDNLTEKIKASDAYKNYLKKQDEIKKAPKPEVKKPEQAKNQYPKTVKKDGFTAIVNSDAEFQEAKSEGWA
jgi:hypothetical protein